MRQNIGNLIFSHTSHIYPVYAQTINGLIEEGFNLFYFYIVFDLFSNKSNIQ